MCIYYPSLVLFSLIRAKKRLLHHPPQRLSLRHRPAHQALGRLDEIRFPLGSRHGRPAAFCEAGDRGVRAGEVHERLGRGECGLVSELGRAEEREGRGAFSCDGFWDGGGGGKGVDGVEG